MRTYKGKNRILSMILVCAMVFGLIPVRTMARTQEGNDTWQSLAFSKVSGVSADVKLDASKVTEDLHGTEYADTDVVRVSIVLEQQATLKRYPTANLASNAQAMAYRESLQLAQISTTARIEAQALQGEPLDVVWNMTLAGNIISANVCYGQIPAIAQVEGVQQVVIETQYDPMEATADAMMGNTTAMIGSQQVWDAGYTGAGMRIAIIDTGIDTDHQSFSNDAYLYALSLVAAEKGMDVESYMDSLNLLDAEEIRSVLQQLNIYPYVEYQEGTAADAYYISEKIPFALNYVDRDYDVTHDDGVSSHGSHVAGIATANRYVPTEDGFAAALETVMTQGVAPDAQVIVMKVFGKSGGAYESDYMVAIEDAILLGCDVVNLSLGMDRGFARSTLYQDILDSLADSDTIITTAAGNSGSWGEYGANEVGYLYGDDVDFSMVASPAVAVNSFSVASVDSLGITDYYMTLDGQMLFYTAAMFSDDTVIQPLTALAGEVNYIFTESAGTAGDIAAILEAEGGTIAPNTVLICSRGTITFGEKANNAVAAGFAGTIVYNNADGLLTMNLDGYTADAPCVSITRQNGQKFRAAAQPETDEAGNVLYYKGSLTISDKVGSGPVSEEVSFSYFSSWGVPGTLQIKPEITAPGGNIYSVNGTDPSGTAYESLSGTSMAAPQVAGMSALVMQYIRENGLEEITGRGVRQLATALLMATAQPVMNGGSYYSVLQQGAGLANVSDALAAGAFIVMDEDATAGASDGKVKAELGDDPDRTGTYSFTFTIHNFSDEAASYSLSSDFFTQALLYLDGTAYLDTATQTLSMAVSYLVDGRDITVSAAYACDLNGDGLTNALDAQIILEYAAELADDIDPAADLDADGTVTTYDAFLLLSSLRSDAITVASGASAAVTVSMTLPESARAWLDANYENGAYLEGFVYITAADPAEPTYSIPVLGFYGNWSDADMFDKLSYEEYLYGVTNGTDFTLPYTGGLNYLTFFDESSNESYYTGNPYLVEDTIPYDKAAIRPDMELGDMAASLIRNAGAFMFFVTDGQGNVVRAQAVEQARSAYYYVNGGYWAYVNAAGLSIWETPESLGNFTEGDQFTVGLMALPEYYENGRAMTADEMVELMQSGAVGDGACYTYTFTVDGQAPEILSVSKNEESDLIISARDNRHIAAVAVLSPSGGSVLTMNGVEQDVLGETVETVVDMDGITVNRTCLVMVADYAGNESYYQVTYNEGLENFEGKMYGFTDVSVRGSANTWMEIDPESLYYADSGVLGGTAEMAVMDVAVRAAEYVGGYVYMITEKNQLIVAPQGDWTLYALARTDEAYAGIRDMAYNYADGRLYAIDSSNTVYTLDLYTGQLQKQYTLSIEAPQGRTFSEENRKLLTLAIDDEGNFYSVNSGDTDYHQVYLYRWSAADVGSDGNITGLKPVNDSADGYCGDYVYSDTEDVSGITCSQSMAWDHDRDILYWVNAISNVSAYNTLYRFDLTTGKVCNATEPIPGVEDYQLGVLCGNITGLYIVPTGGQTLENATGATSVELSPTGLTLLETAQYQLTWDVLPWNLTEQSVTFASADETVATVDENGLITAHSAGETVITVTSCATAGIFATCTVTVERLNNVTLNGILYDADGAMHWAELNLEDTEAWESVFAEENYNFLAGGQLGDVIFVHDGSRMYGVSADTFQVTDYGSLDPTWTWSDAAGAPVTESGYFGRIVGILDGGRSLGVMDVVNSVGYEITHYSLFNSDRMAAIAYIGPATGYEGHEYYILTEGGKLYHALIYAFYDTDAMVIHYTDVMTYVGDTGLRLAGVSNVGGSRYASMYYDEANDYLILSSYQGGTQGQIYAFHPDVCAPVTVGSFGQDVWPLVSIYRYAAIENLTVKVKPETATVYTGETVQLTSEIYPLSYDSAVIWSSSDETVATVDENGLVTTHRPGTVTISATSVATDETGTAAVGSATLTVLALSTVDTFFHACIQTENGSQWVRIDGLDLSVEVLGQSDVTYTGAAVSQGMIYATDETYYYAIDPQNGYACTRGDDFTNGDGAPFLYMLDGTGSPAHTGEFTDQSTGEKVTATVGGYPVYISGLDSSNYHYLTLLNDYTTGQFSATSIAYSYYPAAITHYYSQEIEGYWFDFYLILGYDGTMNLYSLYHTVYGEEVYISGGWENFYVNTGLVFDDGDSVSMVYVQTEDFDGVVISHGTQSGVEFYSYNLSDGTVSKMGTITGAVDLVGLCQVADVGVEAPQRPQDAEAEGLFAYAKTDNGYGWVRIDSTDLTCQYVSGLSTTDYAAAGENDGMFYAVAGQTQYGNTTYYYYQIDPAQNFAATEGNIVPGTGYQPADLAGAPSRQVELMDSTTRKEVSVTVGGYLLQLSNGRYSSSTPKLYLVTDYSGKGDYYQELYTAASTFSGNLAAVAYLGGEFATRNTAWVDTFLILAQDGTLYTCKIKTTVSRGELQLSASAEITAAGSLDLTAAGGASMTRTGENQVLIACNGTDGVTLHSYDVAAGACTELGLLSGVESLVGLAWLGSAEPDGDRTMAAAPIRGSTMTLTVDTAAVTAPEGEDLRIADGTVTVDLRETVDVTNGKLIITYDPSVLTFRSASCGWGWYAVNGEEPGRIVIAFASHRANPAGDVLARLEFTCTGDSVNTVVSVETVQRGRETELTEIAYITVSQNPGQDVNPPTGDKPLMLWTALMILALPCAVSLTRRRKETE